jgi:hypothetical protein
MMRPAAAEKSQHQQKLGISANVLRSIKITSQYAAAISLYLFSAAV